MEMNFYRKIGVLQWKKFVLWLMSQVIRNPKDRKGTNYYLAGINCQSVKSFRKMLLLNAMIHVVGIILCIRDIANMIIANNIISVSMLYVIILFFVNLYCVMLQRYNWLRIRKVLKKVAHK